MLMIYRNDAMMQ